MRDRRVVRVFLYAGVAAVFVIAVIIAAAAEKKAILTGKAAMGDWTSDAPGVMRRITVQDLPPPGSNALAINRAHVVGRPADAQLKVPQGVQNRIVRHWISRSAIPAQRTEWRHLRRRESRQSNQGAAR